MALGEMNNYNPAMKTGIKKSMPWTHYNEFTVGYDDHGHDVKFYGATTGKYMLWDESADTLTIAGKIAITQDASSTAQPLKITATSTSTSASASVESMLVATTMTGIGGVGGRARFTLDTNVALGGWANALKSHTTFGATGSVTGLGSSMVAELTLSAGTTAGTYAPLELELNLATGAKTGTASALIYASVNGDGKGEFDDNGYAIYLSGLSASANHLFQASAVTGVNSTHALRINVGGTPYFIPLHTSATFAG